jgi:hypothetical protein
MQLPSFSYRYNVMVNGRNTSTWFTTRDEARAHRRELTMSSSDTTTTTTNSYKIVRQSVNWGDSATVK